MEHDNKMKQLFALMGAKKPYYYTTDRDMELQYHAILREIHPDSNNNNNSLDQNREHYTLLRATQAIIKGWNMISKLDECREYNHSGEDVLISEKDNISLKWNDIIIACELLTGSEKTQAIAKEMIESYKCRPKLGKKDYKMWVSEDYGHIRTYKLSDHQPPPEPPMARRSRAMIGHTSTSTRVLPKKV